MDIHAQPHLALLRGLAVTLMDNVQPALQNIDSTFDDDAVIIATLECIPFNSHEVLLVMSREELVNVAQTLNAKLPPALA